MEDFLSGAAPNQILILMLFPLIAAILLAGFLGWSFWRRSKSSKMRHGSQASGTEITAPHPSNPSEAPVGEAKINILSGGEHTSAFSSEVQMAPSELDLNMDILRKGAETENSTMNEPKQSNELIDEATALQKSQPDPVSPQPIQPVELLRLLRDPQSGQLIVQIGAQRYTKLSDVADKKIGQYILKLVAHLLVFTNGMIVTEAGLKSVYQPKAGDLPEPPIIHLSEPLGPISSQTPDPQEPAAGPLVPKPPPEAEAAFLASLRVRKPPEPESSTLPGGLFGRSKPAAPPPTLPTLNLAKEINDIVQARLMIAPLSTASKVEVLSARDGGIQIHVDGRFYASPDDIPDPEVKALIKASIKQWERS